MRVPLAWLHEYCRPDLDAAALADRLAMTGTEVERVEHHGVGALEHFVVGKVLERKRHPDADRLSVCMVDIGGSDAVADRLRRAERRRRPDRRGRQARRGDARRHRSSARRSCAASSPTG